MTAISTIELAAVGLVALYLTVTLRHAVEPWVAARRLALLVVASWLSEESCIGAYGFYAYDPRWHLFVDRVPLMVLLIWPVVIHSGWRIAGQLMGRGHRLVPLAAAAIVLADASLIEPISVSAGLWRWTEPGLFNVPPIGLLGWALHAGLCIFVLDRASLAHAHRLADLAVLWVAPLGTHALLLGSWWGVLRWCSMPLPPWPATLVACSLSAGLTWWSLRARARRRIVPRTMWLRAPAAALFFTLLLTRPRPPAALLVYALACAVPYLSLIRVGAGEHRRAAPAS